MTADFIPSHLLPVDRNQLVVIAHIESVSRPTMVDAERYRISIKTISDNHYTISSTSKEDGIRLYDEIAGHISNFYSRV